MEAEPRSCVEFDTDGQPRRWHAILSYAGLPWPATVCGLASQAYPLTGAAWQTTPDERRCARCQASLAAVSTMDGSVR